jgi:hypothetical protein
MYEREHINKRRRRVSNMRDETKGKVSVYRDFYFVIIILLFIIIYYYFRKKVEKKVRLREARQAPPQSEYNKSKI